MRRVRFSVMGHTSLPNAGALALCLVASAVCLPSAAYAQSDDDRAGARAAATAGSSAMQQEHWDEAIDLFMRAESLVHAPPHLLYIARANVKLGRLVRARENYLKITRDVLPAGAPRAFVDAQASANTEVADLEARIPTVKVVVDGDGAAEAIVIMDGSPVASALTGVPHPIDPGDHKFQAISKTLSSDVVTIPFAEGVRQTLKLSLKLTLAQPAVAPPPSASPAKDTRATEPPAADGKRSAMRMGGLVGLGVGAVGIVVGTIFVAKNHSKRDEADALCPASACPSAARPQVTSLDADASSASTIAWIGYGIGVAGVATGATLLLLSMGRPGKSPETTQRAAIEPWFGVRSAGISGRF